MRLQGFLLQNSIFCDIKCIKQKIYVNQWYILNRQYKSHDTENHYGLLISVSLVLGSKLSHPL